MLQFNEIEIKPTVKLKNDVRMHVKQDHKIHGRNIPLSRKNYEYTCFKNTGTGEINFRGKWTDKPSGYFSYIGA